MTDKLRLLSALLLGCSLCSGASGQGVNIPQVPRGSSLELGQAIKLLMPNAGERTFNWDHRADSQISWIDSGFIQETRGKNDLVAVRRGLLRVNVQGKTANVLRQRRDELWWTVSYESRGNPRFGVEVISLVPGTQKDTCFGSVYEGCAFDILPSLRAAGVSVAKVCEASIPSYRITGLSIAHPSRAEVQLRIHENLGSGGATTDIELLFERRPSELCKTF